MGRGQSIIGQAAQAMCRPGCRAGCENNKKRHTSPFRTFLCLQKINSLRPDQSKTQTANRRRSEQHVAHRVACSIKMQRSSRLSPFIPQFIFDGR
eukprot:scaffold23692_cov155-Skeletonema_dohrnii-CCMP3373.AAC.5